jgi:hypothetical protein
MTLCSSAMQFPENAKQRILNAASTHLSRNGKASAVACTHGTDPGGRWVIITMLGSTAATVWAGS